MDVWRATQIRRLDSLFALVPLVGSFIDLHLVSNKKTSWEGSIYNFSGRMGDLANLLRDLGGKKENIGGAGPGGGWSMLVCSLRPSLTAALIAKIDAVHGLNMTE